MRGVHACLPIALLLLAATPYEDTKERFALVLPDGWKLAPRFGDTFGMSFERRLEAEASTALTVHVDPAPGADLVSFSVAAEANWESAGKITPREASRAKVADRAAIVREADQAGRRIRAYFLESNGRFYHLRFEAPPSLLRSAEADWEKILASFRPMPGRGSARATEPTRGPPPGLIGTWRGSAGVTLALRPDRSFSMGGLKGRWAVEEGELVLLVPGKSAIRFTLTLDGDALELSAPSLETPARYTRAAAEELALAGRWRSASGRTLALDKGGRFTMGELSGQWSEREARLTLHGERGEEVTYRYEIEDGELTLAGGDLEEPLVFERDRGGAR